MKPRSFHDGMRGNALFIILIAIALLAALTWSMTRSSRTMTTVSAEDAEIAAQNILSYTNAVMEATERVMVSNGCRDDQVSFENSVVAGYANANAPADHRCHVFEPEGGGLKWEESPADWLDSAWSANALYGQPFIPAGYSCVAAVGTGNSAASCGAENGDVFVTIPFLNKTICEAINKKLRVNLPTGAPPVNAHIRAWWPAGAKFTGGFADMPAAIVLLGYEGLHAACFEGGGITTAPGSYVFYQVLIAR